ncbi:hypothetical protein FOA43_002461 [Brettanomyces nanus]|uniref:BZIP domain-containing protein n=1 Tax=Eeniella nana TaxID=13502 RepID=A0A875S2D9_EENNA|nr:uncharacterized protein FOA43_002461 [Brettanomyces nanus]QPG75118.1 hypothetical protein FOA43_002461 [Brettanomyces nanus]
MLLGESVFSSISAASSNDLLVSSVATATAAANNKALVDDPLEDLFRSAFGESSNQNEQHLEVEPRASSVPSASIAGTLSPLEVHASVMDSIFDPSTALSSNSPMLELTSEMPTWEPLFQQSSDQNDQQIGADTDAELLALLGEPASVSTSASPASVKSEPVDYVGTETRSKSVPGKRSHSDPSVSSPSHPDSSAKKTKLDKFGCVAYTRKQRNIPLSPVVPQGHDLTSLKRAKNTEAARRSRARKMKRMVQLEDKCENLVKENENLRAEVENLKQQLLQQQQPSFTLNP